MLKLVATIAFVLSATAAQAVEYRWTDGFGQGTLEAKIVSRSKDELLIYCGSGQEARPVGMFFTIGGKQYRRSERTYVQFVVDGKNHPFEFAETRYDASGRGFYGNLSRFVAALARSKSQTFLFEVPEENISRSLSLLNAADALGRSPDSIIDGCK
ncbi:hypothetical protein DK419_10440 [Methylobacterium terrae]|uniref:DUF4124 domain-containing protein n=1 Tax=Methylobacterium terrae TaxID=2202827 RepID=A0A2U8WKQ2_9HYPH|nr:hypothetical protein [Methylobacterium terrae]AWN46679.1 hypothetical protein DK419_10440 [Methylobacterium terrae]